MRTKAIPRFFLYGEPPRAVRERFLHLEPIDDRTRPANWNIRPHTHANLCHVFHIAQGGGEMLADDRTIPFRAPCLLLVPSTLVHGFAYESETAGSVLTLSDEYLRELAAREAGLSRVFARAACLPAEDEALFSGLLTRLSRELSWTAIGHDAAVEALLTTLLIEILRIVHHEADESAGRAPGAQADLVARFRERIEARYRSGDGVEAYAASLNVTPRRLRVACLAVAEASPLQLIQERLALEAKRALLYSNMTVAEVAYDLGFDDPAYFSRFFARTAGRSPRAYRATGG
ncbi:helix-turn-helix domain-containing protein [Phenylobacterium sp. SCN 70-31]|uniref:helix-turn-helix domain-containing protein n=1 Tax=Phenylobacterium sp. SCN 70-31 TaxID=1660129 RepID=UPI0008690526|nr:helix-turn-helix domain-containing protein [Phenylobacterium sp. SCN 70-31]ODT89557.1 MAG: AraC family transcriptional regulator [Phenylobacterium sp. SCN 70-31]